MLEALSAGKAIVATPLALEGLDVHDGEHVIVAERAERSSFGRGRIARGSRSARVGRAGCARVGRGKRRPRSARARVRAPLRGGRALTPSAAQDPPAPRARPRSPPRAKRAAIARRQRGRWNVLSQFVLQGLSLVSTLTLARLLTPKEVGLAAIALIFSSLAFLLADLGLGAVDRPAGDLTEADRSTAFWTNAGARRSPRASGVGLSWPDRHLYDEPRSAARSRCCR